MNKKLYVGNLAYSVTEVELREAFGQHGALESVRIIMDKFSGRSKGFGFVEMATEEEAERAINAMNGQEMAGRKVIVSEARPEQPRGGGGGGRIAGNGRFGDRPAREHRRPRFQDNGPRERRNPNSSPAPVNDEDEDNKWNR